MNGSVNQRTVPRAHGAIPAVFILLLLAVPPASGQPNHAKRINVHPLWSAPYSLNGENQYIGIFEYERYPSKIHPEFKNPTAKIGLIFPAFDTVSSHATQVVGLILAKGALAAARGIARKAAAEMYTGDHTIRRYLEQVGGGNWDISNHSYGFLRGWVPGAGNRWQWMGSSEATSTNVADSEDHMFGYYDDWARKLDSLLFKEPTQIPVFASGNQRGIGPDGSVTYFAATPTPNFFTESTVPHPKNGSTGYDVLASHAVSKNAIVVGAVDISGKIWERSSTGPTDDGRIKPDVVALGVDVTVCGSTRSQTGYDSTTDGTSLAAPAVSGSLLLLKQYWEKLFPLDLFTSSIARGLLIHTATDLGPTGPDYQYGWGSVNARDAADLIKLNAENGGFSIRKGTLQQGKSYEFYVKSYNYHYIKVTLAWADPEGTPVPFVNSAPPLDSPTRMLVNDLDIRLYPVLGTTTDNNLTAHPFVLDRSKPSELADKGDNVVDNVEQVHFRSTNPYGLQVNFQHIYKVVIRHKGTLRGGKQDFALLVGGATEHLIPPSGVEVSASGTEEKKNVPLAAANSAFVSWNAVAGASKYDVQYRTVGAQSWTTISNVTGTERLLSDLQAATYQVRVRARNGNVFSSWTGVVQFFGGNPVAPKNAWHSNLTPTGAKINWSAVSGVTQYNVKWARLAGDNTVLGSWKSATVGGTSTTIGSLVPDGRYAAYVRSKYSNNLYSDWSPATSFYTPVDCGVYEAGNTHNDARTLRAGDYAHGLLCKGDEEDWFRIYNPSGYRNLQVTLYKHSKPYRVSVYRSAKGSGDVSLLPGSPPAGIGTKVFTLNNADFTNYDYYVQVWTSDPNANYSNAETYTVTARTQWSPYPSALPDESHGTKKVAGDGESVSTMSIRIYPNPARGSTTVRMSVPDDAPATLAIYDAAGRERFRDAVAVSAGMTEIGLQLAGFGMGVYFVVVESGEGRVVRRLCVVE